MTGSCGLGRDVWDVQVCECTCASFRCERVVDWIPEPRGLRSGVWGFRYIRVYGNCV
jgi:hypothetical protein